MKFTKVGLFVLILLAANASSVSLGAGPGDMYYYEMLAGGYAKKMMMVNTVGSDDLKVTITPDDVISEWLTFEPSTEFTLSAHTRSDIGVIVQLPEDIETGEYRGTITVQAEPISVISEGTGMPVAAAISLSVTIHVTDVENAAFVIRTVEVYDVEVGNRVPLSLFVSNTGNVKVRPKVKINILDRTRNDILSTSEFSDILLLPTASGQMRLRLPSEGLVVGQYWAEIVPESGNSQLLGFNILGTGSLGMKGNLIRVSSPVWVEQDELIKVSALFKNSGNDIITAKFKGEAYLIDDVYKREKLVATFESDLTNVDPDEVVNLTSYFTPTAPGRYSIRGVASYANKNTPEKSTIVNVLAKSVQQTPVVIVTKPNYTWNYISIVLLVIALGWWKWQRDKTASGKMKKGWGKFLDDEGLGDDKK